MPRVPARMSVRTRVPAWTIDAGLAVICTVPGLVVALLQGSWPVVTLSSLGLAGVALFWRRRNPLLVLISVAALGSLAETEYFILVVCLAVFEVASTRSVGHAVLGYVIATGLPLIGTTAKILLGFHDAATNGVTPAVGLGTSIIDPYVVIALAVGMVLQSTRQRRRTQEDLTEQRIEHARALERARIAAEMHDVVGHALTVMISLANGARSAWQTDPRRSATALEHLGVVGATALEDMQRTLQVLRESDHELDEALHRSGHDLSDVETMIEVYRATGLPVHLTRLGQTIPDSTMLHSAIHRIVEECLTNSLRYATDVSRVEVKIVCRDGMIVIDVVDDGRGRSAESLGTGRGLIGIAERAASFGGTSASGPVAPHGWAVHATLPMEGIA